MRKPTEERIKEYLTKKQIKEKQNMAEDFIKLIDIAIQYNPKISEETAKQLTDKYGIFVEQFLNPTTEKEREFLIPLRDMFKGLLYGEDNLPIEKSRLLFLVCALHKGELEKANITTTNGLRKLIAKHRIKGLKDSESAWSSSMDKLYPYLKKLMDLGILYRGGNIYIPNKKKIIKYGIRDLIKNDGQYQSTGQYLLNDDKIREYFGFNLAAISIFMLLTQTEGYLDFNEKTFGERVIKKFKL